MPTLTKTFTENIEFADHCIEIAWLLEQQSANPYRVLAWKEAGVAIRDLPFSIIERLKEGGESELVAQPHIGKRIAGTIAEFSNTGRIRLLESLRGEAGTETILRSIPSIGPQLAHRLHEELGIESLPELELALEDGRLLGLSGFGPRRIQAIRNGLGMFMKTYRKPEGPRGTPPQNETLLALDLEYREKATNGSLHKIKPRRMNPEGATWLPIWHVDRDGYHFTLLYSNSATAHRAGKTKDWVVIFYESTSSSGQVTAITSSQGTTKGQRVIRGL